jgi:hypothetical protein
MSRKCNECGFEKEFSEYHKDSKGLQGYRSTCKDCANSKRRKHREKNIERYREWNQNWCDSNPEKTMLATSRRRALKLGLEFNLTIEDILIPEHCPILGIKLIRQTNKGRSAKCSPSLDRIDSSKGYVKGNVWVISMLANAMKNEANKEELLKFANWILSS